MPLSRDAHQNVLIAAEPRRVAPCRLPVPQTDCHVLAYWKCRHAAVDSATGDIGRGDEPRGTERAGVAVRLPSASLSGVKLMAMEALNQ